MTKGIDAGLLAHATRKARQAAVKTAVAAFAELEDAAIAEVASFDDLDAADRRVWAAARCVKVATYLAGEPCETGTRFRALAEACGGYDALVGELLGALGALTDRREP